MKPIKIMCFSFCRSEFGLLKNLLSDLEADRRFSLQLIVGGAHLNKNLGNTINEIKKSKIKIKKILSEKVNNSSSHNISSFISKTSKEVSGLFVKYKPDIILIMGDRYELISVASISCVHNIPIAHISGGEITEGAIDDNIRHAITKFSHLHFVANASFKKRVKQLGEERWRIIVSGEPGLENLNSIKKIKLEDLNKEIFDVSDLFALITFHPVTNEIHLIKKQVRNILTALKKFNFKMIFTGSNADLGGEFINKEFIKFCKKNKNRKFFYSLGFEKYHNLLKHVNLLVGNTSSGIVEAASYNLPVVNIGNRQKGRPSTKNVFNSSNETNSIQYSIKKAMKYRGKVKNIYFKKGSSKIIRNKIFTFLKLNRKKILTKKFIDII